MTPQSQIQSLESLGITRYRISSDTGINEKTLCNWLNCKAPMKSNSNVIVLTEYYKKITGEEK